VSNTLFQPSKLAAASFGLGLGALVGILVALLTGSLLGAAAESSRLGPGAGVAFWVAALMAPAAIITGIVAKARATQPGWWSTVAIVVGALVLVVVLVTLVFILAITSTKS
jgi:small-conductance mechanosensitive channel